MNKRRFQRLSISVLGAAWLGVLFNFAAVSAKSGEERPTKLAAKLKETFNSLDSNQEAFAIVKLQSGKKVSGFINEVKNDRLVITDLKAGNPFVLLLSNISKIRLVVIQREFIHPKPMKISYPNRSRTLFVVLRRSC